MKNEDSFGLIIGIGKRKSDSNAMAISVTDAAYTGDALVNYCKFSRQKVTTLKNEEATKQNFLGKLDLLAEKTKDNPADLVIIYFSGHGCKIGEKYYLICNDTKNESIAKTGIEGNQFVKKLQLIRSERMLILLDCCHSEGITNQTNPSADNADIPFNKDIFLKEKANRVVITACHKSQVSYVSKPVSIFTYALIEGLEGKSMFGNDKELKIFELAMYIRERVAALSEKVLKPKEPQKPQLNILQNNGTNNFAIVNYPNGKPLESIFENDFALWTYENKRIDTEVPAIRDEEYRSQFKWLVNNININTNSNANTIANTNDNTNAIKNIIHIENYDKHYGETLKDILENKNNLRSQTKTKSKIYSLDGTYKYTCTQLSYREHSHGGTCQIKILSEHDGIYQWSLNGLREWKKEGKSPREKFTRLEYLDWSSDKGVIFDDFKYIFTYNIGVQGQKTSSGYSIGGVFFDESGKQIISLNGLYYQLDGDIVVWGRFILQKIKNKK